MNVDEKETKVLIGDLPGCCYNCNGQGHCEKPCAIPEIRRKKMEAGNGQSDT